MGYVSKRTSELQLGDVVNCHGMRCLIDREIEISKTHSIGRDGSQCRYVRALVLNRDDEATRAVPRHWTSENRLDGAAGDHSGEHRWTIQGNDLATWSVEA